GPLRRTNRRTTAGAESAKAKGPPRGPLPRTVTAMRPTALAAAALCLLAACGGGSTTSGTATTSSTAVSSSSSSTSVTSAPPGATTPVSVAPTHPTTHL